MSKREIVVDEDDSVDSSAGWESLLSRGDTVKRERIRWDWPGRIVSGSLNVIDGRKGCGKSTIAAAIAASVCGVACLPKVKKSRKRRPVLWVSQEESYGAAVVPRLIHAGFRTKEIYCVDNFKHGAGGRLSLPSSVETFAGLIQSIGCGCLVLDPFSSLMDTTIDLRSEQMVRGYLESIKHVAEVSGCTVLLIRHLRKGKVGVLLDAGLHSVAIVNVSRSVLRVDPHPDGSGSFLLSRIGGNYGTPPMPFRYALDGVEGELAKVRWIKEEEITEDEIQEGGEESHEREEFEDAKRLLQRSLSSGEILATELIAEARNASVSERTLRKAKAALGVLSKRKGGGAAGKASWYWLLPK